MAAEGKDNHPPGRGRFMLARENILSTSHGIMIRAPLRPFPWWGPFNASDAIGRAFLLLGLWGIGGIFLLIAHDLLGEASTILDLPDDLRKHPLYLVCLGAAFFCAVGAGMLYRERWAIVGFKFFTIAAWPMLVMFLPPQWLEKDGSSRAREEYIAMLLSIECLIALAFAWVAPFWRYFGEKHVRWEFDFVRYDLVADNDFATTKRFGGAAALTGVALALAASAETVVIAANRLAQIFVAGCFAFAAALIAAGLLFRAKNNGGRQMLLLLVPVAAVAAILYPLWSLGGVFSAMRKGAAQPARVDQLAIFVLMFGLLIPAYVFVEIGRYLMSEKAKAWCGVGEYSPPWQTQLDQIAAAEIVAPEDKI